MCCPRMVSNVRLPNSAANSSDGVIVRGMAVEGEVSEVEGEDVEDAAGADDDRPTGVGSRANDCRDRRSK